MSTYTPTAAKLYQFLKKLSIAKSINLNFFSRIHLIELFSKIFLKSIFSNPTINNIEPGALNGGGGGEVVAISLNFRERVQPFNPTDFEKKN